MPKSTPPRRAARRRRATPPPPAEPTPLVTRPAAFSVPLTRPDAEIACGFLLALLDVVNPTSVAASAATRIYGVLCAAVSPTDCGARMLIADVREWTRAEIQAAALARVAPVVQEIAGAD